MVDLGILPAFMHGPMEVQNRKLLHFDLHPGTACSPIQAKNPFRCIIEVQSVVTEYARWASLIICIASTIPGE